MNTTEAAPKITLESEIARLERSASIYRGEASRMRGGRKAHMTRLAKGYQKRADNLKADPSTFTWGN